MLHHLFIYGSLAPGRPNAHIMEGIEGNWQAGTTQGYLIEAGWGADLGYPAIRLDKQGDVVAGFLFSSTELDQFWPMLDEFEGEAYQRSLTQVKTDNGRLYDAYIYALKASE